MSITDNLLRVGISNADSSPVNFSSLTPNMKQIEKGPRADYYDINATPRVFWGVNAAGTAFEQHSASGSGAVSTVNGVAPAAGNVQLTSGNVQAVPQAVYGIDASQSPSVPDLVNGTPGTVAGIQVFAFVVTAAGQSITVDGNTYTPAVGGVFECTPNVGDTALLWKYIPPMPLSAGVVGTDAAGNIISQPAGTAYAPGYAYSRSTPVIVPSSGNVTNTTGAVTFGGATPRSNADGAWYFFPLAALYAASPAQCYWGVATDTTHVQLYTATYLPGSTSPAIPQGTLTPLITVVGAYSQVATAIVTDQGPAIPAGTLGLGGLIRGFFAARNDNSSGSKTYSPTFNNNNIGTIADSMGTNAGGEFILQNLGRQDRQYGNLLNQVNATSFPFNGTIDTSTVTGTVRMTVTLNTPATDSVEMVSFDYAYSGMPQS